MYCSPPQNVYLWEKQYFQLNVPCRFAYQLQALTSTQGTFEMPTETILLVYLMSCLLQHISAIYRMKIQYFCNALCRWRNT